MEPQETQKTSAEKKRPGRPRKKAVTAPIEVHGVVERPVNDDDVMEMVYCNPSLFKKLLQLYKQFDVGELEMNFDKTCLKIYCKDHLKKSNIYTEIDGRCMNLYYCKMPIRIYVTRDSLERILGMMGKNHYKITFLLKENYKSMMYIVIKDIEVDSDDAYDVDVISRPDTAAWDARDDDSAYPIKFKLPSKHLKARINNIRKISPVIIVQKVGNGPIQLTFDKARNVNFTGVYKDSDKIDLKSTIADDDIFSVSVEIDYVKPFSNSNIGDDVLIAADKTERISFMTCLDKKDIGYACSVKIFTEIKDYRGRT